VVQARFVPFWTIPDVSLFELFMVSWSPIFWIDIWRGTSFSEAFLKQILINSLGFKGEHGWEIPELTKVFMGQFPINGGCSIENFQMVNHLKAKI